VLRKLLINYRYKKVEKMIKEFSYQFHELKILHKDITELMGFNENEIPDPFPELIKKAFKAAPSLFQIKAGYALFENLKIDTKNFNLAINNQLFYPGKLISTQLKNATSCAIFLCTAGSKIEQQSKKFSDNGDQLHSYIYDVLGSVVAEKARIKIELEIKSEVKRKGLLISDSFSPGYCDWNITDQRNLFSLLPKNFCGITLTKSHLMTPIKSVSGIIGIGKSLAQRGYQCNWCNDRNCLYGRINRQKKELKKIQ
jgi:hypothetical protein